MIQATNLSWKHILKNIHLTLNTGHFYALIGPNGAGKTSLLNVLSGSQGADGGTLLLNQKPMSSYSIRALSSQRAVMPQSIELAFAMKVKEVVALGCMYQPHQSEPFIKECLARVGLADQQNSRYSHLSGGQQQRVQLARVLAQLGPLDQAQGKWLFLDEATSSLDLQYQHQVFAIAHALSQMGLGVFAIVHDLNLAAKYADQLLCLNQGQISHQGSPNEVMTPELVNQLYGLTSHRFMDPQQQVQLTVERSTVSWAPLNA